MGTVVKQPEWKTAKTGEEIPDRFFQWIRSTQKGLLKSRPPGERVFGKMVDSLVFRMKKRWKQCLWYTRQKHFIVAENVVFFGDYYFRNLRMLVEIDGDSHNGPVAKEKDEWRSKLISMWRGTRTVRFTNDEIMGGDFRPVEMRFVDSVFQALPIGIRWTFLKAYKRMQRFNPHLYGG